VALVVAAVAVSARGTEPLHKSLEVAPSAPRELTGQLSRYGGLRVLELWGDREQSGYAHGFLLAEQIIDLFDAYVLDESILPDPDAYDIVLAANVRRMFRWSDETVVELEAMLRGARDRRGAAGFRSEKLGRELRVEDLMVVNTIADSFGFMCSSVSIWGELTPDGRTLTGRNLDFPYTTKMRAGQVVIFDRSGARPWAGVGWPGLIGVYTGFNDAGVSMLMHDANGLAASESVGFVPRSLILREALEAGGPETYLDDVRDVFRRRTVMVGNNVHVSGAAADAPAAVFEYDGNARDAGVAKRLPGHNESGLTTAVWCTNHMCLRREPEHHWRFNRIQHKLEHATRFKTTIDIEQLFELMVSVQQSITLHTVVLEPAALRMHVRIPAVSEQQVVFDLRDWLGGRLAANSTIGAKADAQAGALP
jgi:hypothetical protein